MDIYKNIIIISAVLIGSVLLFLGIKDLKLNKVKKGGLFWATLLSVLFFSSCANSQTNISDNEIPIEQSKRVLKLNETSEWQQFKAFWQSLDNEAPNFEVFVDNGKISSFESYNYGFFSDEDKFNNATTELEENIKNLKNTKLIGDKELEILNFICQERIKNLFVFNSQLISHFAPPKIVLNHSASLENLELKIDTLLGLSANNLITAEELDNSLKNINTEIQNILVTSTILSNYNTYIYEGNAFDENTVENNKLYFENHFKKLIEKEGENGESKKTYDEINAELETVEQSFINIEELINDLIENKNSRVVAFEKTDAYTDFKTFWTKIDKIEQNNDLENNYSYENYEKIDSIKRQLIFKIKLIEKTKLFSPLEIEILSLLTKTRLESIQGPNLYTRAIMPLTYTPRAVFEMESKINVLLEMKSKNQIDENEYNSALTEIFTLSDNVIILSIINSNFFFYPISEEPIKYSESPIEFYKETLKNHYLKLITENEDNKELTDDLTIKFKSSMEKLNEIQTALPTIHKLIESFEK
ncbi:MAG: hypothetical protein JXL97_13480 [Bacteroidales bacterium]|nr:hypothetical protein [Bacteroidales bacterium]